MFSNCKFECLSVNESNLQVYAWKLLSFTKSVRYTKMFDKGAIKNGNKIKMITRKKLKFCR